MARKGKNKLNKKTRDVDQRPARFRRYDQLFLIVCEDENTEPAYFRQFIDLLPNLPEPTLYLECVGTGLDPLGVVQRAIQERDKLAGEAGREVDFVWAVFDKDDADLDEARIQRFNDAFELAAKENVSIALSNEVFEVWLLLHLVELPLESPISRTDIYALMEAKIHELEGNNNFTYVHGSADVLARINVLGEEALAIERAKALEVFFSETPAINANPSTRVYRLVELLRGWVGYYNWEP